jgi:hypothetical protein
VVVLPLLQDSSNGDLCTSDSSHIIPYNTFFPKKQYTVSEKEFWDFKDVYLVDGQDRTSQISLMNGETCQVLWY